MTTTCWPQTCASGSAMSRAITSRELPAAVCTIILTGRTGNSSPCAAAAATSASAKQRRDRIDRTGRMTTGDSHFLRHVAQLELLDLAGRGLRQLREHDEARALVAGEILAAPVDQLVVRRARARLELDEGARRL